MQIIKKLNISYNLKKIVNKLFLNVFKRFLFRSNLLFLNEKNITIKSILLYLPDEKIMHLGDNLFFEPLANNLTKLGFKVFICPINAMQFYFSDLGYKIANDTKLSKYDLIISKTDFYWRLRGLKNQILLIDTTSLKIKSPLCDDIVNKVFDELKLKIKSKNFTPSLLNYPLDTSKFSFIKKSDKYIIFNNYINSGSIRSGVNHQKLIIKFIKNLKESTGCKVIHSGSRKDKLNDLNKYDFVDFDIRGKSSVKDIIALCAHKNLIYNVSFDAFQMHLFFILNKKSFILFRGRWLQENSDFIKNYVNPPFTNYKARYLIHYIDDSGMPSELSSYEVKRRIKNYKNGYFSVVVPCYNGEAFIERCIKSIKNQTYEKFEVLLIDDGSIDNSYKLLKRYIRGDSRFKIVKHEKNLGLSAARNSGIKHAKGEFLAFLDIDDWWPKRKLDTYYNYFLKGNDLIYSDYTKVYSRRKKKITVKKKINFEMLSVSNLIPISSGAYNQSKIGAKFFKYKSPSEDWLFWLDLFKKPRKSFGIPINLMFYTVSSSSMSANKYTMAKRAWIIYRKYHRFNIIKSIYYLITYTIIGFKKNYL